MGHVVIEAGAIPDFTTAVFSLWFRVPKESAAAVHGAPQGGLFSNMIPLLTFGKPGTIGDQQITWTTEALYNVHCWSGSVYAPRYSDGFVGWDQAHSLMTPIGVGAENLLPRSYVEYESFAHSNGAITYTEGEPSYIGVYCSNVDGPGYLTVNLSSGVFGTTVQSLLRSVTPGELYLDRSASENLLDPTSQEYLANPTTSRYVPVGWEWVPWDPGNPGGEGDWIPPGGSAYAPSSNTGGGLDPRNVAPVDHMEDVTVTNLSTTSFGAAFSDPIELDVWHHILVSIDLPNKKINVALDDVSLQPGDLSYYFEGFPGAGVVPASSYSFGAPAQPKYSSAIQQVDLAELQVFTGVTLDTTSEQARRAFISAYKHPVDVPFASAGDAISPHKSETLSGARDPGYKQNLRRSEQEANVGRSNWAIPDDLFRGRSVPPRAPTLLLGKLPEIAFTRSCRSWMGGLNLGTAKDQHVTVTGKLRGVKTDPIAGQ